MQEKKPIILITGCSGRIGVRCIERFAPYYQVIGFDIYEPPVKPAHFEWMRVDISSDSAVEEALHAVKEKYGDHILSVLHLAAYYSFTGDPTDKYQTITVNGTKRMLKGMRNFHCEQFLFSSTMLIHAPCDPHQKINEEWPVVRSWDYPNSKIDTESVMHALHGDIPIAILRIAGCYDDGCHSIPISQQIARIYEKQLVARLFPGDITHGSSFLHLDDLIDCIELCVEKRQSLPKEYVIEVGEPVTVSMDEMQRTISRLCHNTEFSTIRIPKWFAKFGAFMQNNLPFMPKTFIKPWMIDIADWNYTLDISKAAKTLGWSPKRNVKETLVKMIRDLKFDPQAWYKEQNIDAPKWLKEKA